MALTEPEYWNLIHAERDRVAGMLDGLPEADWQVKTLCFDWSVNEIVAHLTAGANTGLIRWMTSMLRAGFKPEKHNQRQLARYLGRSPAETRAMFRASITNTTAPTKDDAAWLGEVIVHGQDIARPLELNLKPDRAAVEEVARFYATKDFAVNSKSLISGLTLEANDADFRTGSGPIVRGQLLYLVMAMAGRPAYLADLEGDGVDVLRGRIV